MSLVLLKINGEHECRAMVATNFSHSFCASGLVKSLKLQHHQEMLNRPTATTSDGTPIEFIGEALVELALGPWKSDGPVALPMALDCPADVLIGDDLIQEIGKKFPVKFEFYKNAVNIGGTRVSMLDPMAEEKKYMSVVVVDRQSKEEMGVETWRKGTVRGPVGPIRRPSLRYGNNGRRHTCADIFHFDGANVAK